MQVKVFVLGLPGSGKSTVTRYIEMLVRDKKWFTDHISDYDILYNMFQYDKEHKFRSTDHSGFDVLDFNVFDMALQEVERSFDVWGSESSRENELILIEFARNDYRKALKQFSSEFLRGAYFLFITTDIPTCLSRIRERVLRSTNSDDHFVSEYIFDTYYQKDSEQYTASRLETIHDIDEQRIVVIDNTGSLKELTEKVQRFVNSICETETSVSTSVSISVAEHGLGEEHPKSLVIDETVEELVLAPS